MSTCGSVALDFTDLEMNNDPGTRSKLRQVNYVHGDHSTATQEDNWDTISNFLINGAPATPPNSLYRPHRTLPEAIGPNWAP